MDRSEALALLSQHKPDCNAASACFGWRCSDRERVNNRALTAMPTCWWHSTGLPIQRAISESSSTSKMCWAARWRKAGDIWLAQLDPTVVSEIQKTRPCVVESPDEMNAHLRTVIVAPMTTGSRPAAFRVPHTFQGKQGLIVLDQIRTLDRVRLVRHLGALRAPTLKATLHTLQAMFMP